MDAAASFPASLLFWLSLRVTAWCRAAKKPKLLTAHAIEQSSFSNRVDQLVSFMLNCHLQEYFFRPYTWVTEITTLSDGEQVALDWVGAVPSVNGADDTPVLMLHHGAGGRSSDLPNQTYVRDALERGWLVCALNRRGHKPGLRLSRERWNFFGSTDDLRHVISELVRSKRPLARLVMLGISAGSGLVALYMGEQGLRRRQRDNDKDSSTFVRDSSFCDAAVGVCPGFNTEKCMGNFGPPYSWGLLHLQKAFLRRNEKHFRHKESYHDALLADDLQSWLDNMWSIAHEKYSSSDEYYAEHNPMRVTEFINEPCLFINAEDDPLCVEKNIHEARADGLLHGDMNAALAITKTGSHCCFYELGTSPVHTANWAERVCFEFFDAALDSVAN